MLCVTLAAARPEELTEAHRRFVLQGAELVEYRLDHLAGQCDIAALVRSRPGPIIATVRRPEDGGKYVRPEEDRLAMLRAAIAAGAEYVDLEPDAAAKIPRSGTTRRIVSMHDFQGTPADLASIHARLASCDADIVKLATFATRTRDVTRMLRLVQESRVPTVGLCMGELGTPSRLLAGRNGAPFTYAAAGGGEPLAPGQLSFREMRHLYRYDSITPETQLYGVIGDPIGHSKSPLIHNAAFRHFPFDAVYIPFRVPSSDLADFIEDARELGIRGLSVTIPHKEAVLTAQVECSDAIRAMGAANTLHFSRSSDRIVAKNTDRPAAIESLAEAFGAPIESRQWLAGRTALVLGAGGAAKAIAYGLREEGAEVFIANRTRERAEQLAAQFDCRVVNWDDRHDVRVDILINCTPLGMHPNVNGTPYDAACLTPEMLVFDTVYNPEWTQLLRDARTAGAKTVTGVNMFVRQAAIQFYHFTGEIAPLGVMRRELDLAANPPRMLTLIGYRGTGKSTIAQQLAFALGWEWVDADVELELRAGKSIAAIFADDGEPAFRDLESQTLAALAERAETEHGRLIIAAGGGAVLREENRRVICEAGPVVWLTADVETILARVAADETTAGRRPNLTTGGGEAEVRQLLDARTPLYRQCATIVVGTEEKDPAEIVRKIIAELKL